MDKSLRLTFFGPPCNVRVRLYLFINYLDLDITTDNNSAVE